MLRPRGPCGLKAKSFGLGLTLSGLGLGLDLGLRASGFGLIEIGLVASNIYSAHTHTHTRLTVHMTLINIHHIAIDNIFCCVLVAY